MPASTGKSQVYLPFLVTCALVLAFCHESIASMVELWQLSTYQHAWFIPLISVFLLWIERDTLAGRTPRPSWPAALLFVGFVWIWVVSRMTFVQAPEHVSVWLILNAGVWAVLGWPVYRQLVIPLMFLFLALPVGSSLVPVLMEATAGIAQTLLGIANMPALREGMFFTLPGGRFVVADVCSGYAYLNAGLTISTLFAIFMFTNLRKALLYIAGCGAAFVIINGVRAAIVMGVASATDMQLLAGRDHVIFGWVLFTVGMVAAYAVGSRIADNPRHGYQQ